MDNQSQSKCSVTGCSGLMWWTTLLVAVLAVPAVGVVVASMIPIGNLGQVILFVLTCWVCTYLGMRIMKDPKIADKINKK